MLEQAGGGPFDVAFVVADGLSALAVHRHASALLTAIFARLDPVEWRIAPLVIVEQGRVAIADEIGEALRASISVILIGERPGLSSPDSLGIYITWGPRVGRTDAERNCISNIRADGLSPTAAAALLELLVSAARANQLSGVALSIAPERRVGE
jgi:ethanolamine ammonia-lyase small subunit